jgi:hypothetical protein
MRMPTSEVNDRKVEPSTLLRGRDLLCFQSRLEWRSAIENSLDADSCPRQSRTVGEFHRLSRAHRIEG